MKCSTQPTPTQVLLLEAGEVPEPERVKALMGVEKPTQAPEIEPLVLDLTEFDVLLCEEAV